MTDETTRRTWDTYTAAWNAPTEAEKRAALDASVDRACVYRDPLGHADGVDALVATMVELGHRVPGVRFETNHFSTHHGRSVARWTMRGGDGVALGEGISFGEYGAHGRLVAMTGFFETRDTPGA